MRGQFRTKCCVAARFTLKTRADHESGITTHIPVSLQVGPPAGQVVFSATQDNARAF
jgi:hypothetical protein